MRSTVAGVILLALAACSPARGEQSADEILEASGEKFEFPVEWGKDLQAEHERFLTEMYFRKPVIVRDYPKGIKAFYMRLNDDDQTVGAMDIIVPRIGELIGGSQREERYDILLGRMQDLLATLVELDSLVKVRGFVEDAL